MYTTTVIYRGSTMSHVDHVEVAPRMWDKRIAANYIRENKEEEHHASPSGDEVQSHDLVPETAMVLVGGKLTLLQKLKTYLLPAAFVIGFLLVVYIIYTYVTKYRKSKKDDDRFETIQESDIKHSKQQNALNLIHSEDLSKYEFDSDVESENDNHLPTIEELDESSDNGQEDYDIEDNEEEEEESEDDDEDDEYDEDDDESEEEDEEEEYDEEDSQEPDIQEIEQLILDTSVTGELESVAMLEDEYSFSIPSYIDTDDEIKDEKPKAKRVAKKTKRVTL